MKNYIISQAVFTIVLAFLLVLRVFLANNKIADRILLGTFLLLFLLMCFVQSYLKASYGIENAQTTMVSIISAIVLLVCTILANLVKHHIGK